MSDNSLIPVSLYRSDSLGNVDSRDLDGNTPGSFHCTLLLIHSDPINLVLEADQTISTLSCQSIDPPLFFTAGPDPKTLARINAVNGITKIVFTLFHLPTNSAINLKAYDTAHPDRFVSVRLLFLPPPARPSGDPPPAHRGVRTLPGSIVVGNNFEAATAQNFTLVINSTGTVQSKTLYLQAPAGTVRPPHGISPLVVISSAQAGGFDKIALDFAPPSTQYTLQLGAVAPGQRLTLSTLYLDPDGGSHGKLVEALRNTVLVVPAAEIKSHASALLEVTEEVDEFTILED